MQNTLNLEAEGLQQQKITLGATPVRYEQETEAIVCTASTKLENRRLEKTPSLRSLILYAVIFRWNRVRNVFKQHKSMDLKIQADGDGVGDIYVAHLVPIEHCLNC